MPAVSPTNAIRPDGSREVLRNINLTLEEGLDPSFGVATGLSIDTRAGATRRARTLVDPRRR